MPHRLAPTAYHALAEARGFEWLGPEVPNARTKTGWRCTRSARGHEWAARYTNIQQGSGCPHCAPRGRRRRKD